MNFTKFLENQDVIRPLYFGCLDSPGHYVYSTSGKLPRSDQNTYSLFLKSHDNKLVPKDRNQGSAALHHYPEFTILACVDYTGDDRPGSNSMFLLPGTLTFDECLHQINQYFPNILKRIGKITLA